MTLDGKCIAKSFNRFPFISFDRRFESRVTAIEIGRPCVIDNSNSHTEHDSINMTEECRDEKKTIIIAVDGFRGVGTSNRRSGVVAGEEGG